MERNKHEDGTSVERTWNEHATNIRAQSTVSLMDGATGLLVAIHVVKLEPRPGFANKTSLVTAGIHALIQMKPKIALKEMTGRIQE